MQYLVYEIPWSIASSPLKLIFLWCNNLAPVAKKNSICWSPWPWYHPNKLVHPITNETKYFTSRQLRLVKMFLSTKTLKLIFMTSYCKLEQLILLWHLFDWKWVNSPSWKLVKLVLILGTSSSPMFIFVWLSFYSNYFRNNC